MSGDVDDPPLAYIDLLGLVIVNPMSNFVMVDVVDDVITIVLSHSNHSVSIVEMLFRMGPHVRRRSCLISAIASIDEYAVIDRFIPCTRVHNIMITYADLSGLVHVLVVSLLVNPVELRLRATASRTAARVAA